MVSENQGSARGCVRVGRGSLGRLVGHVLHDPYNSLLLQRSTQSTPTSAMIVDNFPRDSKRSARASSLSTSVSSPSSSTFVQRQPSMQAAQQNHDLPLDDDVPPPYESVIPAMASPPRSHSPPPPPSPLQLQPQAASTLLRESIRRPVDVPKPWSGEVDLMYAILKPIWSAPTYHSSSVRLRRNRRAHVHRSPQSTTLPLFYAQSPSHRQIQM